MALPEPAPFTDISKLICCVDLPVMPEAAQALIRTLSDEDADTFLICRIIKKDPALTATLLRMANSAMFGLSGSVDTLERAVSVVGVSQVRSRALALCLSRLSRFPPGMDRLAFWQYSLRCAGYAQWLAEHSHVDDQEAWLCGMMLRLGNIVLVQARAHSLAAMQRPPIGPGERWQRQRALVGFDEGQVTAELARHWDFPAALVQGMQDAAQPLASRQVSRLAVVLHLAARLADGGALSADSIEQLPSLLLQMLKLDTDMLISTAPQDPGLADTSLFNA